MDINECQDVKKHVISSKSEESFYVVSEAKQVLPTVRDFHVHQWP